MRAELSIRTSQSMVMTPQLLQSIRLLQLSSLEMMQEMRQALQDNVMLEELESSEESPDESMEADQESTSDESDPEPATGCDAGATKDVEADYDWSSRDSWSGGEPPSDSEESWVNRTASPIQTDARLAAMDQLRMLSLDERQQQILLALIDQVDDNGYLMTSLRSISDDLGESFAASLEEIESALRILHGLEPTGFAARSLAECLTLQLEALPAETAGRLLAIDLAAHSLEEVADRGFESISKQYGVNDAELEAAYGLILALDPKPGASLRAAPEPAIPDVTVSGQPGAWRVELNNERLPRIRVNSGYERAVGESGHKVLKDRLQEARWLVRGLEMRNETLLKTARAVFERQKGFLEKGEEAMAPLTLREIAEEIGMHESTVCRVTNAKFIQTPWGVYDFKSFFPSQIGGADIDTSGTAVKAMIRRIIDGENSSKPLCDGAIAAILLRRGIRVARRTVAKYREAMRIAPATARKQLPSRRGDISRAG